MVRMGLVGFEVATQVGGWLVLWRLRLLVSRYTSGQGTVGSPLLRMGTCMATVDDVPARLGRDTDGEGNLGSYRFPG